MAKTLKKAVTLGAAVAAGAVVGSKITSDAKDKEMEERLAEARQNYSYAPAYINGMTIQDWQPIVAQYIAKYGKKLVSTACLYNENTQRILDKFKASKAEWKEFPDVFLPFDRETIEKSLIRSGTSIAKTGEIMTPFLFIDHQSFGVGQKKGTTYGLKEAVRNSLFLDAKSSAFFLGDRKLEVLDYVKACNEIIFRQAKEMINDLERMGITASYYTEDMTTEKFYTQMVYTFREDVYYLLHP